MQDLLTRQGIPLSLGLGAVALVTALILIRSVLSADAGNDAMKSIAGAIQAGAKAYLSRQLLAVSSIAAVMFVAVGFLRDWTTAGGFVIGAVCSLICLLYTSPSPRD